MMNRIICIIQQSYYRLYDLVHYPKTAYRTLKNCLVTGTIKEYWAWLETAIVMSNISELNCKIDLTKYFDSIEEDCCGEMNW